MLESLVIETFQAVAERLLNKHFGIGINDTILCDDEVAAEIIESNQPLFSVINKIAEEDGLERIDAGWLFCNAITAFDEHAAMNVVSFEMDQGKSFGNFIGFTLKQVHATSAFAA